MFFRGGLVFWVEVVGFWGVVGVGDDVVFLGGFCLGGLGFMG